MVLESTMVCVDTSEFMRNSDFLPTRLQAQQEAVGIVCHSKTRSNPENNVGLLTMSSTPTVLATLTSDVGRILSKLHQVQPIGDLDFMTSIRVAHLALKHRQGKNHKMRVVVFVGSPIESDDKDLVKLAKRLKKEKVNVDVVNFGEEHNNTDKLTQFISTLNGREGTGSHLVTVPPGPHLSDALISSPVVLGEDGTGAGAGGAGFEFGIDPNEDPELALALRVSMEEQRQRQEEAARRAADGEDGGAGGEVAGGSGTSSGGAPKQETASSDEALLERALAMSLEGEQQMKTEAGHQQQKKPSPVEPDFGSMTEEEQIAYALQMSLQQSHDDKPAESPMPMDTDDQQQQAEELDDVLENLPGVDPNAVRRSKRDKEGKK